MNNFIKILATATIAISLLLWVPNIMFQEASSLWLYTFVAGLGIILSIMIKSKILLIGNAIAFLSFFPVMFVGYIFDFVTQLL